MADTTLQNRKRGVLRRVWESQQDLHTMNSGVIFPLRGKALVSKECSKSAVEVLHGGGVGRNEILTNAGHHSRSEQNLMFYSVE